MSKKGKGIEQIDFHTGIGEVIPSTQQAYHQNRFSKTIKKAESDLLIQFKQILGQQIERGLKTNGQFPSKKEIFVFIIQYFASHKEYSSRDVDNMAKTILDVLKGKLYFDDGQVKTLLAGKKMEKLIPQNFAYVAVKELKSDRDVDALKISGLERSITLYRELKSQGYI